MSNRNTGRQHPSERVFLGIGVAMVIELMWVALRPVQSIALEGPYRHYTAHFLVFAALAIAWTCGLPRVRSVVLAFAIVVFAFVHEAVEIYGHAHGFELYDAIVDSIAAVVGVACTRLMQTRRCRKSG